MAIFSSRPKALEYWESVDTEMYRVETIEETEYIVRDPDVSTVQFAKRLGDIVIAAVVLTDFVSMVKLK